MKIKLVVLFAIAFMTACTNNGVGGNDSSNTFDSVKPSGYKAYGTQIEIVVIDECEYLYSYNFNATWMTHKGNCKNPIHNCK